MKDNQIGWLMNSLIILFFIFLGFAILHTLVRIVSHFYKFPLPVWMADFIDHPIRHKIQPPEKTAIRHGIRPGMRVLEVGPGNGSYTLAAARRIGNEGHIIAVDIQPRMIEKVLKRANKEGITNLEARVADVHNLPFENGSFDAIFMITVIGEIPHPDKAVQEFFRVLKPSGSLAFSELFIDPDYLLPRTLIRMAIKAGFQCNKKIGNFFYYTLLFQK